jgi:hypothetical protein
MFDNGPLIFRFIATIITIILNIPQKKRFKFFSQFSLSILYYNDIKKAYKKEENS